MRREQNIINDTPVSPAGYTQLEYIESTGTQYIDTNILLTNLHFVELTCNVSENSGNYLYGCHSQGKYVDHNMFVRSDVTCGRVRSGSSSNESIYIYENLFGQWHTFGNGNRTFVVDGVSRTYSTSYSFTSGSTCYVFWSHSYNSSHDPGNPVPMKLSNFKITLSGNCVMNCIPVLRNADGKPGLYDLVNDVFYTNAGTGEFLYA
jgi:hypothetical protein